MSECFNAHCTLRSLLTSLVPFYRTYDSVNRLRSTLVDIALRAPSSCQLTEAAKIPDFTTKDLSNPTPDRVQIVLSGLINFHLFEGEQNEHILAPLVEENEENTLNEEELITKNQALREKIEAERYVVHRVLSCLVSHRD